MLSSLGGVELLFPLLEQVDSPLKVHEPAQGKSKTASDIDQLLPGGGLTSVFNGNSMINGSHFIHPLPLPQIKKVLLLFCSSSLLCWTVTRLIRRCSS